MARKSKPPDKKPGLAPEKIEAYLDLLSRTGLPYTSARAVGLAMEDFKALCSRDRELRARRDEALEHYNEKVEAEIHRRGIEGVDKPIFWQGERVDMVKEYSDTLLIALARKRMPGYRDKGFEASVAAGGVLVVNAPASSAEEWAKEFGRRDGSEATESDG